MYSIIVAILFATRLPYFFPFYLAVNVDPFFISIENSFTIISYFLLEQDRPMQSLFSF